MLFWIFVLICFTTIAHAQIWGLTGSFTNGRVRHTATLLPNGNVLVAGGFYSSDGVIIYPNRAELYSATTGVWTVTGSLTYGRVVHTATLLTNGNVLVAGGTGALNIAELYNPTTGLWTVTGSLTYVRQQHTATLLPNGNVLIAGGNENTAELYNATTGAWTLTGFLTYARFDHTATLLTNGNVLVAGGTGYAAAELYSATTGVWTVTGSLNTARFRHTATLLTNGNVLVAAGAYYNYRFIYLNSSELYNATTGVWTLTGSLTYSRWDHTATLLPNGNVLVAGGFHDPNNLKSAEVYNATTGVWTVTSSMKISRDYHTATLLQNGLVLATGFKKNCELFSFEKNFQPSTSVSPTRVFSDKITFALESTFEQKFSEQCHPMYAQSNIPDADPEATIQVMLVNVTTINNGPGDFLVAIYSQDEFQKTNIICSQEMYNQQKCGVSQVGEIILTPLYDGKRYRVILDSLEKGYITEPYIVKRTGMHCIVLYSVNGGLYTGDIYFQYSYGYLPPIKYPYLPFYGFSAVSCGIIGLVWIMLCVYHWEQITKVQIFCGSIIFLCLLEAIFTFAYYTHWNSTGVEDFSLFVISCVLTGARSSVSLVALLVLCKRHGLVNDAALGYTTWFIILGLGLCNFFSSIAHSLATRGSYIALYSTQGLFFVPTLIIFYVWMLYSISKTIAYLSGEKQTEKRTTFVALRRVLFVSLAVMLGLTAIMVINLNNPQYYKTTWNLQWLIDDGSFYLAYCFVLMSVLYLFRPQHNNMRVGVDQLATEEPNDDFDMLDKKNMDIFVETNDAI